MKSATLPQTIRKPKIKIEYGDDYKFVQDIVSSNNLHTVCEEARCPNMFECWGRGTATIMILGDNLFSMINSLAINRQDSSFRFESALLIWQSW